MSLQVIYENDFRIVRTQGWNNGLPGGKEYWVIYATEHFPDKPAVVEKLEDAIEWIKAKAGLTPSYSVSHYSTTKTA
jgi:hypothetical protein